MLGAGGVALLHRQERVLHHGKDVYLRLSEPPTPVPEPLARLPLEPVDVRANINTATDRDSR